MKHLNLSFLDLGISDYAQTLYKQKELWLKRVNREIPDTLILTEHLPVFTIGKHGKIENLLISEPELNKRNISLYRIERGGDITFHGLGQIVGYPIFKLAQPLIGIKQFINKIEQCLGQTLNRFNITARMLQSNIGVWVQDKKIASIGIAIQKRVSFHGFALNVSTDLSYFDLINPCGQKLITMTTMEQVLQKKVDLALVKDLIKKEFTKVFN